MWLKLKNKCQSVIVLITTNVLWNTDCTERKMQYFTKNTFTLEFKTTTMQTLQGGEYYMACDLSATAWETKGVDTTQLLSHVFNTSCAISFP